MLIAGFITLITDGFPCFKHAFDFQYTKAECWRAFCLDLWSLEFREIQFPLGLGGSENERLKASIQAALVARNGVLVQNALLHALVERGDGGAELDSTLYRLLLFV